MRVNLVNIDTIKQDILKWIPEEYPLADITPLNEKNTNFKYMIQDKTFRSTKMPYFITSEINRSDRIFVHWDLELKELDKSAVAKLPIKDKQKLEQELRRGFIVMNLSFKTEPNFEKLEVMRTSKTIFLDGWNKHNLIHTIKSIVCAYYFVNDHFVSLGKP